jgi:hypothetical protein
MTRGGRARSVALGLVVATTALTGCAGETDRYCDELAEQRQTLSDLAVQSGEPGEDVLDDTLRVWRTLRDEAPGDIEDEWTTLVFALEGLVEAFRAAGTTPDEYDPASPPPGVSEQEAEDLQGAAAELASGRVTAAGDAVEQHARDVCKVDLGLSSQGG